jgi:putative membrane protein
MIFHSCEIDMSRVSDKYFSKADKARIEAAVKSAEQKTSGEIVPYVVEISDFYDVAEWRAAGLLGVIALGAFVGVRRFSTAWLPIDLAEVALITVLAAGLGALLVRFAAPLKRFFAGRRLLERRVHQRAAEAFIAEEVFATRGRTGIMIFLSLLEHQVLVVGDAGISAKVKQSEWDDIVRTIVSATREGKPTDGIVSAIQKCGTLLQREGVKIRPDDTDELPDNLRIGDNPQA